MAETFRTTKLEKFIAKKIQFMEHQQRVIEEIKKHGFDEAIGSEMAKQQVIHQLEVNQNAIYNTVFDLCKEFGIEMPHVLGVTPKTGGY